VGLPSVTNIIIYNKQKLGHIHQNPSPPGRYINVCVEAIDYTPVHIETLAAKAKKMLDQG